MAASKRGGERTRTVYSMYVAAAAAKSAVWQHHGGSINIGAQRGSNLIIGGAMCEGRRRRGRRQYKENNNLEAA